MANALTIRLEKPETLDALDRLARATDRSRNWLANRALEEYLELQAWQVEAIEEGLVQADRGEFASSGDIEAVFASFGARK